MFLTGARAQSCLPRSFVLRFGITSACQKVRSLGSANFAMTPSTHSATTAVAAVLEGIERFGTTRFAT